MHLQITYRFVATFKHAYPPFEVSRPNFDDQLFFFNMPFMWHKIISIFECGKNVEINYMLQNHVLIYKGFPNEMKRTCYFQTEGVLN